MEFPISIREVEKTDLNQICLIRESNSLPNEKNHLEIVEERIRNYMDTFLLVCLDEQVIGYLYGTLATEVTNQEEQSKTKANSPLTILELAILADYHCQGFGTLLLAAFKEKSYEQNRPGISSLCPDKLVSYFEMNGFIEEGMKEDETSSQMSFRMFWSNPYYQEEV